MEEKIVQCAGCNEDMDLNTLLDSQYVQIGDTETKMIFHYHPTCHLRMINHNGTIGEFLLQ